MKTEHPQTKLPSLTGDINQWVGSGRRMMGLKIGMKQTTKKNGTKKHQIGEREKEREDIGQSTVSRLSIDLLLRLRFMN